MPVTDPIPGQSSALSESGINKKAMVTGDGQEAHLEVTQVVSNETEEAEGRKKCSSSKSLSSKILLCGSESKRKEVDENSPSGGGGQEGTCTTSKGRKSCRKGSKKKEKEEKAAAESIPLSNIEVASNIPGAEDGASSATNGPSSDHGNQNTAASSNANPNHSASNSAANKNNKSCRLCWCCCCSCSCLSGSVKNGSKNKESSKNESSIFEDFFNCNDEDAPSFEEAKSWGESFDKLIKSYWGRRVFREFLKCEYSEENILFYAACEDLKQEEDPEKIEKKCRLIYENYISILSPREVSLDSRVREVINKNMVKPSKETFEEAQLQIYTLMMRDSYPRFVNSANYKQVLQQFSPDSQTAATTAQAAIATTETSDQSPTRSDGQ